MPTETLLPNAAGDLTQLTASSGANYQCVDEATPNTTDYVINNTNSAKTDLYNVASPTNITASSTINAITVTIRSLHTTAADAHTFKAAIKENGVTTKGAGNTSVQDVWTSWTEVWATRPSDAGAWTYDDLVALQIGVEDGGAELSAGWTTWVKVDVSYDTPSIQPPSDTTQGVEGGPRHPWEPIIFRAAGTIATASQTTNHTGVTAARYFRDFLLFAHVTTIAGTSPTLNVHFESLGPDGFWQDLPQGGTTPYKFKFDQFTATGMKCLRIIDGGMGKQTRAVSVLGANSHARFGIFAWGRREDDYERL